MIGFLLCAKLEKACTVPYKMTMIAYNPPQARKLVI